MPLKAGATLFSQAWVDGLRGVPQSAMVAECRIFRNGSGAGHYNPETNSYDLPKIYEITEVPARVQPMRNAATFVVPNNTTTIQNVLFSVPVDTFSDAGVLLRPGDQVRVTDSPLNTALLKLQYVVLEEVDSSNPVERTFICTVNQETVA